MAERPSRRTFLKTLAAGTAGAGLAAGAPTRASAGILSRRAPGERVTVAVIGTGGRGTGLAQSFGRLDDAAVAWVCDPDEQRMAEAADKVAALQPEKPRADADLRRILEDPALDAVVIAAPNHWHAPASILAMQAGKHVYVEKPASHNPREGELLVKAMRRYDRVVQMGNQRRSWPTVIEGIERIRGGVVGPVHYSRGWYANTRPSIGRGAEAAVPSHLHYDLWQGPAPRTPYRDNILHYNWHWFWRWGSGESGNNGVHAIDLCRWGLEVDHPVRVTSAGGRYFWEGDDQETPDTQVIGLDFEGGKSIVWEGLSCNRRGIDGTTFGASFHGREGTVVIEGLGYKIYDKAGRLVEEQTGRGQPAEIGVTGPGFDIDRDHLANFVDAVRTGATLRSPIDEGQKSTLLCHLGNIAHRTGRTLHVDPSTGRILGDPDAMRLWGRKYAAGWEPRV